MLAVRTQGIPISAHCEPSSSTAHATSSPWPRFSSCRLPFLIQLTELICRELSQRFRFTECAIVLVAEKKDRYLESYNPGTLFGRRAALMNCLGPPTAPGKLSRFSGVPSWIAASTNDIAISI